MSNRHEPSIIPEASHRLKQAKLKSGNLSKRSLPSTSLVEKNQQCLGNKNGVNKSKSKKKKIKNKNDGDGNKKKQKQLGKKKNDQSFKNIVKHFKKLFDRKIQSLSPQDYDMKDNGQYLDDRITNKKQSNSSRAPFNKSDILTKKAQNQRDRSGKKQYLQALLNQKKQVKSQKQNLKKGEGSASLLGLNPKNNHKVNNINKNSNNMTSRDHISKKNSKLATKKDKKNHTMNITKDKFAELMSQMEQKLKASKDKKAIDTLFYNKYQCKESQSSNQDQKSSSLSENQVDQFCMEFSKSQREKGQIQVLSDSQEQYSMEAKSKLPQEKILYFWKNNNKQYNPGRKNTIKQPKSKQNKANRSKSATMKNRNNKSSHKKQSQNTITKNKDINPNEDKKNNGRRKERVKTVNYLGKQVKGNSNKLNMKTNRSVSQLNKQKYKQRLKNPYKQKSEKKKMKNKQKIGQYEIEEFNEQKSMIIHEKKENEQFIDNIFQQNQLQREIVNIDDILDFQRSISSSNEDRDPGMESTHREQVKADISYEYDLKQPSIRQVKGDCQQNQVSSQKKKQIDGERIQIQQLFREEEKKWLSLKNTLQRIKNTMDPHQLNEIICQAEANHLALKKIQIKSKLQDSQDQQNQIIAQSSIKSQSEEKQQKSRGFNQMNEENHVMTDQNQQRYKYVRQKIDNLVNNDLIDNSLERKQVIGLCQSKDDDKKKERTEVSLDRSEEQFELLSLLNGNLQKKQDMSWKGEKGEGKKINININISNSQIRIQSSPIKNRNVEVSSDGDFKKQQKKEIKQQSPKLYQELCDKNKDIKLNNLVVELPKHNNIKEFNHQSDQFKKQEQKQGQTQQKEKDKKKKTKLSYDQAPLQITKIMKSKHNTKEENKKIEEQGANKNILLLEKDLDLSDFISSANKDSQGSEIKSMDRVKILDEIKRKKMKDGISISFRTNSNNGSYSFKRQLSHSYNESGQTKSQKNLQSQQQSYESMNVRDYLAFKKNEEAKKIQNLQINQQEKSSSILLSKQSTFNDNNNVNQLKEEKEDIKKEGKKKVKVPPINTDFEMIQQQQQQNHQKDEKKIYRQLFPWLKDDHKQEQFHPHVSPLHQLTSTPINYGQNQQNEKTFQVTTPKVKQDNVLRCVQELSYDLIEDFIVGLMQQQHMNGQQFAETSGIRIVKKLIQFYNIHNISIHEGNSEEDSNKNLHQFKLRHDQEKQRQIQQQRRQEQQEQLKIEQPDKKWQHQFHDQQCSQSDRHVVFEEHTLFYPQSIIHKDLDYVLTFCDQLFDFAYANSKDEFFRALVTPLGSKTIDLLKVFRKMQYIDEMLREKVEAGMELEEQMEDNFDELPGYQSIMPLEIMLRFEQERSQPQNGTQQIFNQAIFQIINLILDDLRPYGRSGLPPINFLHLDPKIKLLNKLQRHQSIQGDINIGKVKLYVKQKLIQIYETGLGSIYYNNQHNSELSVKKLIYGYLRQMQEDWAQIEQGQFDFKYKIMDYIEQYVVQKEITNIIGFLANKYPSSQFQF